MPDCVLGGRSIFDMFLIALLKKFSLLINLNNLIMNNANMLKFSYCYFCMSLLIEFKF